SSRCSSSASSPGGERSDGPSPHRAGWDGAPARLEIVPMRWHQAMISVLLLSGAALGQQLRVNPEEGTPLASASQSLQLARARVLEAAPDAAAAALGQAARHLAAYEALFPGPRAEQAEYMRQQILEQTARMHNDPNEVADRIFYLWLEPVDRWNLRAGR